MAAQCRFQCQIVGMIETQLGKEPRQGRLPKGREDDLGRVALQQRPGEIPIRVQLVRVHLAVKKLIAQASKRVAKDDVEIGLSLRVQRPGRRAGGQLADRFPVKIRRRQPVLAAAGDRLQERLTISGLLPERFEVVGFVKLRQKIDGGNPTALQAGEAPLGQLPDVRGDGALRLRRLCASRQRRTDQNAEEQGQEQAADRQPTHFGHSSAHPRVTTPSDIAGHVGSRSSGKKGNKYTFHESLLSHMKTMGFAASAIKGALYQSRDRALSVGDALT